MQKRIKTEGHILDRVYINFPKKTVMIFASKRDLEDITKDPYRIMDLEEFDKEYKTMIRI